MEFTIDRTLPLPIRLQLKGLIEYGIACGTLSPGEALPSVRELALQLDIAPRTVSQVYADLKSLGLIEASAGSGTFVADNGAGLGLQSGVADLNERIDGLADQGLSLGLGTADLLALIHARLASRMQAGRRRHVAMVGLFQKPTLRYARLIAGQIGSSAKVGPVTIEAIQRDPALQAKIAASDLVITFANHKRNVANLLPGAQVISIRFIPAEATQHALAALAPDAKILLVARVPEFLPIMKAGIARFVAHPGDIRSTPGDPEAVAALAATADVLVYASGSEDSLASVPGSLPTIEYAHIPDPEDVQRRIIPLLRLRG